MKSYYTHRGVNLPPYLKGFPMSLALMYLGIMVLVVLLGIIMAYVIGNFTVGATFFIVLVGVSGYYLFGFFTKVGAFGIQKKIYIKYFNRVDKFYGGRPKIYKIKL